MYLSLFVSTFTEASAVILPCLSSALLSFSSILASPALNVVPFTTVGWYRSTRKLLLAALATAIEIAEIRIRKRLVMFFSSVKLTLYSFITVLMKRKFEKIQET